MARLLAALILSAAGCGGPRPVALAAASSLVQVVPAVLEETGGGVHASFAASSTLARQIEHGLEVDVFLSADRAWVDYLRERDLGFEVRPLAHNVLVAWTRRDGPRVPDPEGLRRVARIAVGDEVVPVGRYARRALEPYDLQVELLPCRNARAVVATVKAGEADVGIAYATDSKDLRRAFSFPRPRVEYWALRCSDRAEARALFDRVTGESADRVFQQHGFLAAR